MRTLEAGGNRAEYGGSTMQKTGEDFREKELARFTEVAGLMRENIGDNHTVIVISRNQDDRENEGNIFTTNMEDSREK